MHFSNPRAGADRGGVHDACAQIFLQGIGLGPATHGAGAVSDRAAVWVGGSRQGAHGRAETRTAQAAGGSGGGGTAPTSTPDPRRSFAEEACRKGGAPGAESVGSADSRSPSRRSG